MSKIRWAMDNCDTEPMPDKQALHIRTRLIETAKKRGMDITAAVRIVTDDGPNMYARSKLCEREWKTERRGIMLVGGVGVGKTLAFYLVAHEFQISMVTAGEATTWFAASGEELFWKEMNAIKNEEVILDDLGAEREIQSYGNSSPIGEWLQQRYAKWQLGGQPTHVATNLTVEQLRARYGSRVLDRLSEMCRVHGVSGDSMRKTKVQE